MQKLLCLLLAFTLLVSLCACGKNMDVTSSDVQILYEEEVVYEGDISEKNDISFEEDTTLPSDVSSVPSEIPTTSNTSSTSEKPQENICYLNDSAILQNIKFNGRCDKTDSGVNLNMAASAIEFNTDSTSVLITVEADSNLYYSIMIDGEITAHHQPIESYGTNYIVAARGLSGSSHNIKLIRDSESRTDLQFTVESIQLDEGKKLLPNDSGNKVIEFLGDSLTSGYGNIVENGVSEPQSLKNQSSVKAYPFLLANKLGYDYRIVSMSGIALAKREGYPSFPEFYALESYHIDKTKKYTSSNPQDVDIVVVNLGTNDVGAKMYDSNSNESVNKYKEHFVKLITDIGYRKDAKIVFITGVWYKEPITAINLALTELEKLGYTGVYTAQLKEGKDGGGSHPSGKQHQEYADKLEKFFKDNGIA